MFLHTLGKGAKEVISGIGSHNVEPFSMTALDGVVGLQSTLEEYYDWNLMSDLGA